MVALLLAPLVVQAVAMFVDEMYFHRKRGLPRWERIGHPLDTLTVLACFGVAAFVPWSLTALGVYVALAAVSCLFITKDEFVHSARCSPGEQWLHAVLFVLHPIVLGAAAFLWYRGEHGMVMTQLALTLAFCFYQIVYWNVPWSAKQTR